MSRPPERGAGIISKQKELFIRYRGSSFFLITGKKINGKFLFSVYKNFVRRHNGCMYLADLHIHSKYSRATGKNADIPNLDLWARRKGITLVGTGDFTHPAWRDELAQTLEPAEEGLYRIKKEARLADVCELPVSPRFVVSGEISCI